MEKLYGFSSASLLAILTVAVRKPVALGSKVIVKVVVPPALATLVAASVVNEKSAAWVPPMVTRGLSVKFNGAEPVVVMVKVFGFVAPDISRLPKSVSSAAEGVPSPSDIELPDPDTSISGAAVPVP